MPNVRVQHIQCVINSLSSYKYSSFTLIMFLYSLHVMLYPHYAYTVHKVKNKIALTLSKQTHYCCYCAETY